MALPADSFQRGGGAHTPVRGTLFLSGPSSVWAEWGARRARLARRPQSGAQIAAALGPRADGAADREGWLLASCFVRWEPGGLRTQTEFTPGGLHIAWPGLSANSLNKQSQVQV